MDLSSRILSSRVGQRPVTSRPMTGSTRPLTSTGLMAPKSSRGKSSLRRQVQDKSYYISLLRSKISELSAEMASLSKDCDSMTNEESRIGVYHRKAETLAKELAEMSHELGIYNEFNDRLRLKEDENEIKEDIKALKLQNEEYTERLELSYEKKKKKEELIVNYENELKQIQNNWINLKRQFTPEDNKTFETLEKSNEKLGLHCEQLESEINVWKDKKNKIEVNSLNSNSLIRREILQSMAKVRELEKQRNHLVAENTNSGDERGRLLAQVKRDNNEISVMESKIAAIKEQIQDINSELQTYEDVGATLKYKELKKKEETIDQFLNDFGENKNEELNKIENMGDEINEVTGRLSRCLVHIDNLSGNTKERETNDGERSRPVSGKQSIESLRDERRKLELDFNKIEQLESKIGSEMDSLRSKIKSLETDIEKYSDIPKLKAEIEEKLSRLEKEKQESNSKSSDLETTNEMLKTRLDSLETSIDNNDINKKLQILENKLQDILSINESIKLSIDITANTNIKAQVFDDIKKYNQKLLGY
ncbi:intraflagellar transport protein 74 homolog [Oppia nitens]|uniref:intraflagellar transport protein 74 homolog n=1 Tax=Oppia nitens TaxID=1686743 RepID=UPI0023DBDD83|nr:intraflagellar transport protein 74 homolog [Oppia nitens]